MEIAFPVDGGQITLDIRTKNPYNESELLIRTYETKPFQLSQKRIEV